MSAVVELLMETAQADVDLLIKNQQLGDQSAVARDVDFYLYAPTFDKANLVAGFINDYRYGRATAASDGENHKILVQLKMPTDQHVLCAVSGFFACLSKIYGIEYDGWETSVERGDD